MKLHFRFNPAGGSRGHARSAFAQKSWWKTGGLLCGLLLLFPPVLRSATVSWVGGSGDWNTPANWSTGALPGPGDDVVIGAGPAISITHSSGAHSVKSISSQQAFALSGGSLNVASTLQVNNSFTLSAGTLVQATVLQGGNGASFVVGGGTLDGVTVNGNWDVGASVNGAVLTVLDGLSNNGTLQVGNPTNTASGELDFSGSQTLGGTGTVVFGKNTVYNSLRVVSAGATLTIGAGLTVRGQTGWIGYNQYLGAPQNVVVVNQGVVSCDVNGGTITIQAQPFTNQGLAAAVNGGSLSLAGVWGNAGTIGGTNGTINLGGNFATTNLGTVNTLGETVNLTGTLVNSNATLSLGATTGSWVLAGGTMQGGTIAVGGGGSFSVGSGALDGVTVNGNWDVGASVNGAVLTVLDGLTNNGTLLVGNPTNSFSGELDFSGSQTLGGSGTVVFGKNSIYNSLRALNAGTTFTIGAGQTVRGETGWIGCDQYQGGPQNVAVINQGVVSCDVNGGTITIQAQPFTNQGLAQSINGGSVNFAGPWVNAGTISVTNSTITLGGTVATANLGTINAAGGSVHLTGTLVNSNATLALGPATGPWALSGGTVQGGTIAVGVGGSFSVGSGTLDGVTVDGNWDVGASVNGAVLTVLDGLTNNGTLLVGNPTNSFSGELDFSGSQTLGGTGTVVFGKNAIYNSMRVVNPGTTLTIGAGQTVRGQTGWIGYDQYQGGPQNVAVINQGVVSCDVTGGTITVQAQPFTNQGLAQSVNGGSVNFAGPWVNAGTISVTNSTINLGGIVATANLGTIDAAGGIVHLTGTLVNSNATLALGPATGPWVLSGGTVQGGTIAVGAGGSFSVGSGTLDGVTVNGNWDVGASVNGAVLTVLDGLTNNGTLLVGNPTNSFSGELDFSGSQTLGGTGTVVFGKNAIYNTLRVINAGTTLTIGAGQTVRGQTGWIGYNQYLGAPPNVAVVNQGVISCDVNGGTITIQAQPFTNQGQAAAVNGGSLTLAGAWGNVGTIAVTNSMINLGGTFATANLGAVSAAGGTVNLTGILVNSNATLALGAASGSWVLNAGTVQGGAIAVGSGGSFTVRGGTLDGVTVNGNWDVGASVNGAALTVLDGLTNNGTLLVGNPTNSFSGELDFSGSQTLGGSGTVIFGKNSIYNSLRVINAGATLTIGAGLTVRGQTGWIGYNQYLGQPQNVAVVNQGVVSCDVSGGTFTVQGSSFTNEGIIQAANGGILQPSSNLANQGTVAALSGGSVDLPTTVAFTGQNWFDIEPGCVVPLTGSLLGNTKNSARFTPLGVLDLNGAGTASTPQQLEVMGQDYGNSPAGFSHNFNYGVISLATNTYVQLIDDYQNSGGSGPEALYVDTLVVPPGATLDVNGLHVYVRNPQIGGNIIHGYITTVVLLASSLNDGEIELAWPTYVGNFVVQSTTNLVPPVVWRTLTNNVTVAGNTNSITMPVAPGASLFRLKGQ